VVRVVADGASVLSAQVWTILVGVQMTRALVTRSLKESEYPQWTRFVAGSSSGSVYALPSYLKVLCEATRGRFEIVGVFSGTELVGGMPLYLSRFASGWIASNRLLLYYHGPILRDYSTKVPSERTSRHLAVLGALETHLRGVRCLHLALHSRHPIQDVRVFSAAGWDVSPSYSYVVDIQDLDAAWARVHQNLRRLVERARAHDLVVTEDEDFQSFYRMHRDTHRRKGAPLYLKEPVFRRFFEHLRAQDLCRLYQARLPDGRSVAAQLVLTGPHPVTHTVSAAADAAHLSLGSTPFLRWGTFEALAALGYAANDLTDAALNDVTRFKSQLGGDLVNGWVITRPGGQIFALHRWGKQTIRRLRGLVGRLRRWR
jgi:hypothetical protein